MLSGRNVILHVRSLSIMEIFEREEAFLNEDTLKWNFTNVSKFGREKLVIALHYSATLDVNADRDYLIEHVLKPAAKWYCDYCDWEDENMYE